VTVTRPLVARAARYLYRVGLAAVLALGASAGADDNMAMARRLHDAGQVVSLEQVLLRARGIRPGTLIDAELVYEAEHASYVYQLLMLDQKGDIWEVEFDAGTGALVEQGRPGD
jgi:uncharacterized membrane protein YkoI